MYADSRADKVQDKVWRTCFFSDIASAAHTEYDINTFSERSPAFPFPVYLRAPHANQERCVTVILYLYLFPSDDERH